MFTEHLVYVPTSLLGALQRLLHFIYNEVLKWALHSCHPHLPGGDSEAQSYDHLNSWWTLIRASGM